MSRWFRYLDKVLIVASFLMATTALWIMYSAIEDVRSAQKDFRENLAGMAAHADYELLTLLDYLDRFQAGEAGVTHEDVIDRFDIFWSRIETNSSGRSANHYLRLRGAEEALAKARRVLEELEPKIPTLQREDVSGIREIKRSLRTLASDIHFVTLSAISQQARNTALLHDERTRSSIFSIMFLSGVLVTGIGVIAALWFERRQLNRLSATLESRVEDRTRELRSTEKRIRDIVEAASDWFWELDADLRFTDVSERYARVAGVSSEGLLGKRPEEVYARSVKRQGEAWKAYFSAVRDRKDFREFVHDDFRQDGRRRVIRNTGKAIFNEDGIFTGYRGTSTDITELKVTEEALQERETMLNAVIENVPVSLSLKDREGRFTLVNPGFERLHGVAAAEILGKTFYDILPHEVAADATAEDRQVLESGEPLRTEYSWPAHLGVQHELIFKFPLRSRDKGPITGVGVIALDVSEQKRAEEELRESEERYRELFDVSPVAIWEEDWSPIKQMLDDLARSGVEDWRGNFDSHRDQLKTAYDLAKVTEISLATVDIYGGANKEELARASGAANVIDDELDAFRDIILSFLAGQMTLELESKDTRVDGLEIMVRRRVVIPPKYHDDWSRVIYAIEDITERARVEDQLRQAQKMEVVGQLTGGVAHDFNNLLAVIQGNAELLIEKGAIDASLTDPILRASARGSELTQRLLAFSRQQALVPQAIDLGALVSGMSELLTRTLGETIDIEIEMVPNLRNALADPGQVENALLNLGINARDAMPGGGKLTIECENVRLDETYVLQNPEALVGDYVVLAVSDTGTGMSREVQAQAFEPFFTTKEVGEGSGLGLSMVYGFAKQTGGHVSIYSEEGQGTTVKVYLPRAAEAAHRKEASQKPDVPRGGDEAILVIEDDPDVRALAVRLLESLGYRVIDVPDAAAAQVVLADENPVDLVLSDVVLPGGTSGPEFAEQAHRTYPDLKIIFMSGYPAESAKRNGFLGSDQVLLNKPFRREQLAKALRDALD